MQPQGKQFSTEVGGHVFTFETGKLAGQAGGSVTVRLGDSLILAVATMSGTPREGLDFFPLTVDYEERMYAGGRIPGSFFRREGRPGDDAILIARLTDRPIRPLFAKGMRNDVQVILYAISADIENPLDILAVNAASAALMVSDIPWGGPIGAVRIGWIDGQYIANPTFAEMEHSLLDLRMAGTREAILMVECGANELPEDVVLKALAFGHEALQPLIDLQEKMAAEAGKAKREVTLFSVPEDLTQQVYDRAAQPLEQIFGQPYQKEDMYGGIAKLEEEIVTELGSEDAAMIANVKEAFEEVLKKVVRGRILERHSRPDGRSLTDIRSIWGEVGISPRAHGSGLFTRGETQVLTLATLGTPKRPGLDSLPPRSQALHPSLQFPPFSTGGVKRCAAHLVAKPATAPWQNGPWCRSSAEADFPIRCASSLRYFPPTVPPRCLVCGSTLALMDTGCHQSARGRHCHGPHHGRRKLRS